MTAYSELSNGHIPISGNITTGPRRSSSFQPRPCLAVRCESTFNRFHHRLFLSFESSAPCDDVSVFAVKEKGLELLDRESSGGKEPVSVTVKQNKCGQDDDEDDVSPSKFGDDHEGRRCALVYVLNAGSNVGASDNITGFVVNAEGKLSHLSDSTRPLSAGVTAPAQIKFPPDGRVLVVTEKATNIIDTYSVGKNGRATGPIVTPSDAQTPFGFYLANGNQLFISDDFNDALGAGSLSSYLVSDDGSLQLVSSSARQCVRTRAEPVGRLSATTGVLPITRTP